MEGCEEMEDGEVEMGEEERLRYSEQLEAEGGHAAKGGDASMYEAGAIQVDEAGQVENAAPPPGKRKRRGRRGKGRARKALRHEEDEDGDFGGMFDETVGGCFVFDDGSEDSPAAAAAGGAAAVEEYEYEDDDDGPMQKVAFVVEGEPNFELAEPDDGWEFVRRVKWEAKAYPDIHVAKVAPPEKLTYQQTSYMPAIPGIPTCDPELLPSKEWEQDFIRTFVELRCRLEFRIEEQVAGSVPHMRDEAGWKSLCFGGNGGSEDAYTGEEVDFQDVLCLLKLQPFFTTVVKLDEVHRANLLRQHVSWFSEVEKLPRFRAMWFLALTAAVDKPVDAETSFALRSLLRTCAAFRASRTFTDDYDLQMLNRIIAVTGIYFGQDDTNRM